MVVSSPQSTWAGLHTAAPASTSIGSVVITGGTGALGLLVAGWLVAQQACTRVVLLGRSGRVTAGQGQQRLQELLHGNGLVSIVAADVAAAADSAAAVQAARVIGGAVLGVIHAAGVLEDAALRNQTMTKLKR